MSGKLGVWVILATFWNTTTKNWAGISHETVQEHQVSLMSPSSAWQMWFLSLPSRRLSTMYQRVLPNPVKLQLETHCVAAHFRNSDKGSITQPATAASRLLCFHQAGSGNRSLNCLGRLVFIRQVLNCEDVLPLTGVWISPAVDARCCPNHVTVKIIYSHSHSIIVEPSSASWYVACSHFPALARSGTMLFLMGRDAVADVAAGLPWNSLLRDEDCSASQ